MDLRPTAARDQIAIREVGRRTISATVGNVPVFAACELLLPGATGLPARVVVPIFIALITLRLVAHHRPANWVVMGIGSVGCNLLWGVMIAGAITGPNPGLPAVYFAFILCGFGVGTVTNAAPSPWFMRITLAALTLPPLIVASTGYATVAFTPLLAVFVAFCLLVGKLQGRTFWEMVAANEQLRDHAAAQARAHDELRAEVARRLQVEVELRQAQKLEAIGRLAAGLAHEINTPVQFVTDSCRFLGDGLHDLEAGLADYRALVEDLLGARVTADAARARIDQIEATRDLPYLRESLGEAADRALDGLGRVAKIVRATKEFSRSSETKTGADLNSAIESTLVICRNETSQVADVVVDLGELPLVMCQLGELNQVFLNILINAAHAIGDAGPARGTITIATRAVDGWVQIAITDTGTGIPPQDLDKIFEPFFTTKEVGRGTGQGLAIARSIVVGKHGGRLDVESRVGNGTTFTIWLPS